MECDKLRIRWRSRPIVPAWTRMSSSSQGKLPEVSTEIQNADYPDIPLSNEKTSFRQCIREIVWDTLDRSPEERRFIFKIDFFILYDFSIIIVCYYCWLKNYIELGLASHTSLRISTQITCVSGELSSQSCDILLRQGGVLTITANAYVSGMKEELNVVGNEYQTFTTMWTM
jgi:ACS family pantothenate transporter-like MFS transporter